MVAKIRFDVATTPRELRVVIEDDGSGFGHDTSSLDRESSNPDNERRGIILIRNIMDEVSFNPAGNQITLVKRSEPTQDDTRNADSTTAGAGT